MNIIETLPSYLPLRISSFKKEETEVTKALERGIAKLFSDGALMEESDRTNDLAAWIIKTPKRQDTYTGATLTPSH